MNYDICIIGGGPGGYSAAIRGAQLGGRIALVEREALGGTCLNHGCIPTKNLYAASELLRKVGEAEKHGIKVGKASVDFSALMARKNEVVTHLRGGVEKLFKAHKIDLFEGKGALEATGKVRVERLSGAEVLSAKKIILATGSEAADIPPLRIDGRRVLGNRELLALTELPKKITIVGGGPIGCEFANIFARLGTEVVIIEVLDRLLPYCEREVSRLIRKRFEERGIEVLTGQAVASAEVGEKETKITLADGSHVSAENVLMAVGRRLNSFGLGLEEAGVEMEGNAVKVNDKMETSIGGVYAVGDLTGKMALAHVASQQGKIAAANALGGEETMDYSAVPWAVYVHPEIASVGRGEASLKEDGVPYRAGRFPYLANGKAVAMREEDGFVKVLASKEDERVLGVHIVGAHASDLIAEATLAMKMGCKTKDIAETIHAHPTLAESLQEAWEDTEGMAIHKVGRRSA